jgi:hypothetical protein
MLFINLTSYFCLIFLMVVYETWAIFEISTYRMTFFQYVYITASLSFADSTVINRYCHRIVYKEMSFAIHVPIFF